MNNKLVKHPWMMDQVMRDVWLALHRDLSPYIGDSYDAARKALQCGDIAGYRSERKSYSPFFGNPYNVKVRCQLNGFLDRYIFANDSLSDSERRKTTLKKMMDDEKRISTYREYPVLAQRVLQRARSIIAEILGPYDEEEHMQSCRFGRRAALKVPFDKSYLCEKLVRLPMTGSRDHIAWFKRYTLTDPLLRSVLKERKDKTFLECDFMFQSFVPKSFDKLRGILPNGQLGVFYTFGLGAMLTKRLLNIGLDIRKLQKRHRALAKRASVTRKLTTADLRAASNSITVQHIMHLFPREWCNALRLGRVDKIYLDKKEWYKTHTFAGMGNGFTFPLQTLVFYSLIKAIAALLNKNCFVSVYGDDLIYSSWLHQYVERIFPMLGFVLNKDKTFCDSDFRESCGGDYYRGIDVRPAKPEGQAQRMHSLHFLSKLYQLRNSLLARWDAVEIPSTMHVLLRYICNETWSIHVVPPDSPEDSGVRVEHPHQIRKWPWYIRKHVPMWAPYAGDNGVWFYQRLIASSLPYKVASQSPYLWDELRAKEQKEDELPCPFTEKRPKLRVMSAKKYYRLTGEKINWRHSQKLLATVSRKGSVLVKDDEAAILSWPIQGA